MTVGEVDKAKEVDDAMIKIENKDVEAKVSSPDIIDIYII